MTLVLGAAEEPSWVAAFWAETEVEAVKEVNIGLAVARR
jgi:hypothetical protein